MAKKIYMKYNEKQKQNGIWASLREAGKFFAADVSKNLFFPQNNNAKFNGTTRYSVEGQRAERFSLMRYT